MAPFGQQRTQRVRDRRAGDRAGGALGAARGLQQGLGVRGADGFGEPLERADRVIRSGREEVHLAVVGHQRARLVGVGEERRRWLRVDEHQVAGARELGRRELREVREPVEGWEPGAALEAGRERLAEHLGAGLGGDPGRGPQPALAYRRATEQQRDRLPGPECLGRDRDRFVSHRAPRRHRAGRARRGSFEPRDVRRDHECRHLARRTPCCGHRIRAVVADLLDGVRRAEPAGDVVRERIDVRVERRVVLVVVGRVVADEVDDGYVRASRVVQVRDPVAETGTEVQQGGGGPIRHAGISVGRARDDSLEQSEDRAHLRDGVERGDEVHLRRARVREADVHPRVDERTDQGLGAVHCSSPGSKIVPGFRIPDGSKAVLIRRMRSIFTGSSSSRK